MQDNLVVGVDGSEGSRLALRWALKEAQYRGVAVKAVASWHWQGFDESLLETSGPQTARDHTRAMLDDIVDAVLAEGTGTPPTISREVVEGYPAEVLVQAAADADLLVIGSHGHSRLRHATLGSVGEACMQHATCPVVVVPLPHEMRRHAKRAEKVAH
jgi:nucleotide-binding universal stress UspA family protein